MMTSVTPSAWTVLIFSIVCSHLLLPAASLEEDGCLFHDSTPPPITTPLTVSTQCASLPEGGNCTTLTEALGQLDSTPVLYLARGVHRITRHTPISSLQDIFIYGDGKEETRIMCDMGIGLSFFNTTGLTLCGFTIDGCGLTGDPISTIERSLQQSMGLWFRIPESVRYAVVLGECRDVSLVELLVTRTVGMGLLGVNVLGNSTLHGVNFTHNARRGCKDYTIEFPFKTGRAIYNQIGGGAYFLYQDHADDTPTHAHEEVGEGEPDQHQLVVANSEFSRNAECSYSAITHVNFFHFPSFSQDLFTVGAGGGLSMVMSQGVAFNVDVAVRDSVFVENEARYGGGVHVAIFASVDRTQVSFERCRFLSNGASNSSSSSSSNGGGSSSDSASLITGGGGLAIFTDLVGLQNVNESIPVPSHDVIVSINILNTMFERNRASVEGGGLLLYSLSLTPHRVIDILGGGFYTTLVTVRNCSFSRNAAPYGAAAFLQQNTQQGRAGSIRINTTRVSFTRNVATLGGEAEQLTAQSDSNNPVLHSGTQMTTSAVALLNVYMTTYGDTIFSLNRGTALFLQSSLLTT